MGGEEFISNKTEGTDFREIVLQHLKRILEISSEELRLKETFMKSAQGSIVKIGTEDTRKSYVQAVEALAIVLLPHFDYEITGVYQKQSKIMNAYRFELEGLLKDQIEELKEKYRLGNIPDNYFTQIKVTAAKELFTELNLLLSRQDYLKRAMTGE